MPDPDPLQLFADLQTQSPALSPHDWALCGIAREQAQWSPALRALPFERSGIELAAIALGDVLAALAGAS